MYVVQLFLLQTDNLNILILWIGRQKRNNDGQDKWTITKDK